MSGVAILGAGELGGAIAHAIATRGRLREVTIIDDAAGVAAGKALDLLQAAPIDRVDIRLASAADPLAAAGASVIVLADAVTGGEWRSETALALVGRLLRAGTQAAFVFAGANQVSLMTTAVRELRLPPDRAVATAPSAVVGAARALVGLEVDGAGASVSVVVGGCPPKSMIAWSSATVGGSLVTDAVPPHRLRAIGESLRRFWPPSPRAVAAPTARIVEALVFGSRQTHQAAVVIDGEFGLRGVAAMLPLVLGRGRVLSRVSPSLSPQERTEFQNAIAS